MPRVLMFRLRSRLNLLRIVPLRNGARAQNMTPCLYCGPDRCVESMPTRWHDDCYLITKESTRTFDLLCFLR